MLVSACQAVEAEHFVSNPGAHTYLDEAVFTVAGIKHSWQHFEHPIYDQGKPFIPNLSIVDLLFNTGPRAREVVVSSSRMGSVFPEPVEVRQ